MKPQFIWKLQVFLSIMKIEFILEKQSSLNASLTRTKRLKIFMKISEVDYDKNNPCEKSVEKSIPVSVFL